MSIVYHNEQCFVAKGGPRTWPLKNDALSTRACYTYVRSPIRNTKHFCAVSTIVSVLVRFAKPFCLYVLLSNFCLLIMVKYTVH